MAVTPDDASDRSDVSDEESKLELPSLGGLLRRGKKRPEPESEPEEPESGLARAEPDEAPEPVELGSEGDDDPDTDDDDPISDEPSDDDVPHDTDQPDHGPDLVAPATAYTEGGTDEPEPPRRRRPSLPSLPSLPDLSLPLLEDRFATPLTGVLVGLLGFVLTYLARAGCGAVRGAGSCGSAGLPLLIVVVVLMVFVGSALLRAWYVAEPLTTSFLAVALVAVVSMVLLLPVIDRWFMVIVIPLLGAAAYWLSWWVTSRFDAPEREAQRERENAR